MKDFGKLIQSVFSFVADFSDDFKLGKRKQNKLFRFSLENLGLLGNRFGLHTMQLMVIPGFQSRIIGSMKRVSTVESKFYSFNQ